MATQLLPKMSAHDDVESYLMMFEAIATQEGWPREEWARVLAPLLTGEPQRAYFSTQPMLRESYDELRREIMARVGLSPSLQLNSSMTGNLRPGCQPVPRLPT